jgi:prolyl-tRNA synthetase
VALILRGDHELNALKAQRIAGVATPLRLASAAEVSAACGCEPGYIGPVGLTGVRVVADHAALAVADFVCGANEKDMHLTGVNWGRDLRPRRPICATWLRAIRAPPDTASSTSCAASRWVTSFSSDASTAPL